MTVSTPLTAASNPSPVSRSPRTVPGFPDRLITRAPTPAAPSRSSSRPARTPAPPPPGAPDRPPTRAPTPAAPRRSTTRFPSTPVPPVTRRFGVLILASLRLLRIRRKGRCPRDTRPGMSRYHTCQRVRVGRMGHGVRLREAAGVEADPASPLPVLLQVEPDLRGRRGIGQPLRHALGPHYVPAIVVRVEVQVYLRVRLDVPQLPGARPGVGEEPLPVPEKPHGHRLRLAVRAHRGQPGDVRVPQPFFPARGGLAGRVRSGHG